MVSDAQRRPLKRGPYLVQNRVLAGALGVADFWGRIRFRRQPRRAVAAPRCIVVGVNGHVGDALISLWPLARLRAAFPQARLIGLGPAGLQATYASAGAFDDYLPLDHWRVNRERLSAPAKWTKYRRQKREAVAKLRHLNPDAAVDLYFHFPNHARVLAAARIPVRIGFSSGGFGPWFTHAAEFDEGRHVADIQGDLVDELARLAGGMAAGVSVPAHRVADVSHLGLPAAYIVLHPGTGARSREWQESNWQTVVRELDRHGVAMVLTGAGAREQARNAELARLSPHARDLTGQLSWTELAAIVSQAKAVVGVESMIGHFAALFARPTVSVYSGINQLARWRPYGPHAAAVIHPVPCYPCNRSTGCDTMDCVRGVSADKVLARLRELVPLPSEEPRS